MELKKLIRFYRKKKGFTLVELGELVHVSPITVYKWESGAVKKLKPGHLEALTELFGPDFSVCMKQPQLMKPILGVVKAGYGLDAYQNIEGYRDVTPSEAKRGDYFLRVTGSSMIGARICDGDLIYVRKCETIDSGKIAVVLVGDEEATVKTVRFKDDLLILEPSNQFIETRYFNRQEVEELPVRILGEVISVIREI
ncbi:MAG: helix-turn-helix domain-containing protein [Erysipelotrichaceae bacterium]|jgi:repressor LexA|nr:helix-turn-helix domain-containing protein [Erysipelotrichaceae bacterium]